MLCEPDASGRWNPVAKGEDEMDTDWNGVRLAISPSLFHPILQLAAMKNFTANSDDVVLAARTPYQVHISKMEKENDRLAFASSTITSFRSSVSHVAWNPHFGGELAVVFDTGELCVYDVQMEKKIGNQLRKAKFTLNDPSNRVLNPAASSAKGSVGGSLIDDVLASCSKLRSSWFRSEYGWHPRTLLMASAEEVSLFDLRTNAASVTQLGRIDCTTRYCRDRHVKLDRFGALARSELDSYEFSMATLQHLLLFDIRRPKAPLLQWEHKMVKDSPGCLSIFPLSSLRPAEGHHSSGRVILATSYRSGDIRAFCYGLEGSNSLVSSASSRFREVEEAHCAWQLPSKVFSASADSESWLDSLITAANFLKTRGALNDLWWDLNCVERVSGLALLPHMERKNFELIQLTGFGEIWSQTYTSSKSLDRGAPKSVIGSKAPRGLTVKKAKHAYRSFPSLCNYVRHGRVLPQSSTKGSPHKKLKMTDSKTEDLVYEALSDVDIPLCTFELAYKVLQLKLPEGMGVLAAKMPANVSGYALGTSRPPYLRPILKILEATETFVPLPLPLLLEAEPRDTGDEFGTRKIENRDDAPKSGHAQFADACELVEDITSKLSELQVSSPEGSSSSSGFEQQELARRLCFHSKDNVSRLAPSAARSHCRKFVGSRSDCGAPISLEFRTTEGDLENSNVLQRLQSNFDRWQRSFEPYQSLCDKFL